MADILDISMLVILVVVCVVFAKRKKHLDLNHQGIFFVLKVAQLVAEEFFQQGDREAKELHMTPMVRSYNSNFMTILLDENVF